MMVGFSTDNDADPEIWINPIEVNAVRPPLPNEFGPTVRTVIFAGAHKFGVCESLHHVLAVLNGGMESFP